MVLKHWKRIVQILPLLSLFIYQKEAYCINKLVEFPSVNFHSAMSSNNLYDKKKADTNLHWKMVKDFYDKYIIESPIFSEYPRIPKIIHQIWLGSPFPEKYRKLQESWLKNHPDWKYILWTDKDIKEFGLENEAMYERASNYGEKSDIARYEILYRIGGLYVDTDFECLKPFDIFHHCCDFYAGLCTGKNVTFINALIGCFPGHPIMRECVKKLQRNEDEKDGFRETLFRTGPVFFTKCFLAVAGREGSIDIAFPSNVFYPWPYTHRDQNTAAEIQSWVKDESFGIHHWAVSWNEGKTN